MQEKKIPGSSKLEKLFYVAQRIVKYHEDPATGEMIVAPWVMAEAVWNYLYENMEIDSPTLGKVLKYAQPMGDCDDKTTFLMALLFNRGFKTLAVGAWQKEYSPEEVINHVYPEVKVDGRWIPLEPSSLRLKVGEQSNMVKPVKRYKARVDGAVIE